MNNEINPIIQRCRTISKNHHWEQVYKTSFYYNGDIALPQKQIVYVNGKRLKKCLACDLVDDLYEGQYM